jgi:site-specific DNA-methyltransferase (adenine-specific)
VPVILADALDKLKDFADGSFDSCITDPPYGLSNRKGLAWAFSSHVTVSEIWDQFTPDTYFEFTLDWLTQVCRVVKAQGNIIIFGSFHSVFTTGFIFQQILHRRIMQDITYVKSNPQPNITRRLLTSATERIIWGCNASAEEAKGWYFDYNAAKNINKGKQLTNVWTFPVTQMAEKEYGHHPTQKPQEILERLITIFTPPGAHVLDPFAGSGTTAVACKKLNREYTVIEQRQEYVEIIKKRLECSIPSLIF